MNDYPPEYDDPHVIQFTESDVLVAWSEDGDVYIHQPNSTNRDDGYIHIGTVEYEASDDPAALNLNNHMARVRAFVREHLKCRRVN